ncbi:DEAD/DEAH box helicase family protein [Ornithinibacter aureus]|uniref:DEAD/DEAH box helicase family protein n=1 Tax=Ornithinibacter aureus TaxID=622664 RepID=UPI00135BC793|nr:DEAD/DEAH box helicase family protein [Ornithinibacter aureus]
MAVVEAKRAHRSAADGVQQAIRYAEQLDVPLAYASNGSEVIERDMVLGVERVISTFPTPPEMWARYAEQHGLDDETGALLRQGFNRNKRMASGEVMQPRWYQSTAVHGALAAMARGERRLLLLMATGTGKTFTAMQIVHKLRAHAKVVTPERNYRVLYLADRDALLKQPMGKDFSPAFGGDPLMRVSGAANRSREIYFATYQSLTGVGDEDELFREYPPDFFDLVIVDECHRGSASENSSWRRVLDHFASAVQLGLTATPKQDDTVDTYRYFGEPLFTYSLRQGHRGRVPGALPSSTCGPEPGLGRLGAGPGAARPLRPGDPRGPLHHPRLRAGSSPADADRRRCAVPVTDSAT